MIATRNAADVENDVLTRYRQRTSKSRIQHEIAQRYLPSGDTRMATHYRPYPTYMVKGEGAWLTDCDGNRYLDLLNNFTSLAHGHANPAVVEDAADQLMRGTVFGSATQPQVELAKLLIERIPGMDLLRFTNSGTEATMMMMRAARAYTGRDIIVKIDGGYHGAHDFVKVNISADVENGSQPQAKLEGRGVPDAVLNAVMVVPFNDLSYTESVLREHHQRIAALIVEPIPNSGGMIPPAPGYLRGLRELTARYDILLLLDEIVSLRVSSGGMQEIERIAPDLTALGKVIGGGFPIGAFGGKESIMQHFDPDLYADFIQHSGTFNGNNITMIAGLAAMRMLDQAAINRINELGQRLQDGINQICMARGIRARCHGYGSLQQIQWTDEPIVTLSDVRRATQDIGKSAELLHLEMLNHGLHSSTRCMFNISTPTQESDIDTALEAIEAAFDTLRPYFREAAPRLLR